MIDESRNPGSNNHFLPTAFALLYLAFGQHHFIRYPQRLLHCVLIFDK
jgi:hypothetical protein